VRRVDVALLAPGRTMAKKRAEKGKRDDVAVKIDRTLGDKAKFVASRKGSTMAEYLSELLRGPVEKDFDRAVKEMGAGGQK
jgi:hypothetical protein